MRIIGGSSRILWRMVEMTKAIWNMRKEFDWDAVYQLAKKIGINVVLRRLGYLLTILNMEENLAGKIKAEITPYPYSFLDPVTAKTRITYSKEYGLVINRTKDEMLDWMEF